MIDPSTLSSLTFAGVTGLLKVLDAHQIFGKLAHSLMDPKNKRILHRIVWISCVVIFLAISSAAIFGGAAIWVSYKPGIVISVVIWSLFLGTTASLLLPSKMIIATFGGLIGVTLSEVSTGAGLISVVRKQVVEIAIELGGIIAPGAALPTTPDPFITWMIWLFVAITALLCLPAFVDSKDQ